MHTQKCDLGPHVRAFLYKAYLLEASSLYALDLQRPGLHGLAKLKFYFWSKS